MAFGIRRQSYLITDQQNRKVIIMEKKVLDKDGMNYLVQILREEVTPLVAEVKSLQEKMAEYEKLQKQIDELNKKFDVLKAFSDEMRK